MKNGRADQIDTNQTLVLLIHLEWVESRDDLFHIQNRTQANARCRILCCDATAL